MALSFSKLLTITIAMVILCHHGNGEKLHQTTLVFFMQDVAKGPNATVSPVIGISGKVWSYNTFGTIFVVDDPITLAPNRNSTPVGRVQGLLTASSLDGSNVSVMVSIVFTNLQYNGSTLEIQGISRQLEDYREVAVVSGTGRFRFARGYATFETLSYDPATTYSLIRLSITLLEA
ncbi:dirigent protein 23-like [Senna tora]|uniref:Dirigent protein n=1 Tax=Senna tora TaxID=362788 RepID=A0A834TLL2_9FABA|nr:dirigent protein 23-like [Senna tora]